MPAPPAAASGPSTVHPDRAVPRPDRPPAAPPHPSICPPIPVPRYPIVVRAGGNRNNLDLRGWWSLRRHGTYGRRIGVRRSNDRCLSACRDGLRSVSGRVLVTRHVHHPALHAAGQGHDNTGEQYQQTKFVGLHKSASQASLLDAPWLIMVSTFSRFNRFGHHLPVHEAKSSCRLEGAGKEPPPDEGGTFTFDGRMVDPTRTSASTRLSGKDSTNRARPVCFPAFRWKKNSRLPGN